MILVDGKVYQVRANGKGYPVPDTALTPFASVTFFDKDQEETISAGSTYEQFTKFLDAKLPALNKFYAVRIDGTFSYMKTRSVPAQQKPYPPLAEVTKNQPVFEVNETEGTVVGFRCPEYVAGVNVPGYHLHFINKGGTAGGHLLDFKVKSAVTQIDDTPQFLMRLPNSDSDFYKKDLKHQAGEIEKTEK